MRFPPLTRRLAALAVTAGLSLGAYGAAPALATGGADATGPSAATSTTAVDQTISVTSRTPAAQDQERLSLALAPGTDLQPTKLYLPPRTRLTVEVSGVAAGDPNGVPSIAIGAPDSQVRPDAPEDTPWYELGLKPRVTPLKPGSNVVSDRNGGIVYLSYPAKTATPSTATVTFGDQAEPMATFTLGKTTERQFQRDLDRLTAPFVEFYSQRSIMSFQRSQVLLYRSTNHADLLRTVDDVIGVEDRLAGYSTRRGPDTLPPAGPHHLTGFPGGIEGVGAYATDQFTVYPTPIQSNLLVTQGLRTGGWGPYHEIGHQHQMRPVNPSGLVEVTVNIYSLAVQREFEKYGQVPRLRATNAGQTSHWDDGMAELQAGIDDYDELGPFAKLLPFEQLRLAYGEQMLTRWHDVVRQQPLEAEPSDEVAWQQLIYTTSVAAGADLSDFWEAWGVEVTEETRDQIADVELPEPTVDPTTLRESTVDQAYSE